MDEPRSLWSLQHLVEDQAGHPWAVTFELCEIDGVLECVGMSIRSFASMPVGTQEAEIVEAVAPPGTTWETVSDQLDELLGEDNLALGLLGTTYVAGQRAALDALASGVLALRPLTAATMRGLAFASELSNAKRAESDDLRRVAAGWRKLYPDVESAQDEFSDAVESLESSAGRSKPGPKSKYGAEQLLRVAAVYNQTAALGLAPTKAVLEDLKSWPDTTASQSVAEKLVTKAKDAGLIPKRGPSRKSGQS